MSDPREGLAKFGDDAPTNERLIRSLSGQLTEEEKTLRDREIVEQAHKYFGGLSAKERDLLGVGRDSAVVSIREESVELADQMQVSESAQVIASKAFVGEWVWAALCGLVFVGVLVWVIRGQ